MRGGRGYAPLPCRAARVERPPVAAVRACYAKKGRRANGNKQPAAAAAAVRRKNNKMQRIRPKHLARARRDTAYHTQRQQPRRGAARSAGAHKPCQRCWQRAVAKGGMADARGCNGRGAKEVRNAAAAKGRRGGAKRWRGGRAAKQVKQVIHGRRL